LTGLNSPREVILLANQIIRNASAESPQSLPPLYESMSVESMSAEYKKACESVAVDFDEWDPDSEYLKEAAKLFLEHQDNVLTCEPGNDKYMIWTGMLKALDAEIHYGCFINTSKNARTVLAILDRCKTFLQKHPNGLCTYITDMRCDFKTTWNATNERRREVESLGGNIVILDQHAAVRWYGLVSLSLKIGSGDIIFETEYGLRTATDKDLANFLKSEFSSHAIEGGFDRIIKKKEVIPLPIPPAQPQPLPTERDLIDAIRTCLVESAFPILAMETLIAKLSEKGINVTREYCLEQIGKNQNVISLIPSRDSFMVKPVM
jgi:hypothetical protein